MKIGLLRNLGTNSPKGAFGPKADPEGVGLGQENHQ